MVFTKRFFMIGLLIALVLTACGTKDQQASQTGYVLTTGLREGKLVFIGIGGSIDGQSNPVLKTEPGQEVTITLINGEGAEHDIFFPEFDAKTERVSGQGNSVTVKFMAPTRNSVFTYYDSVPGHMDAGMKGYLQVGDAILPPEMADAIPAAPVSATGGKTISYALESAMADGKMVFSGKGGNIDGLSNPDLKANVGDTIEITLTSGEGAQHDISFPDFNATSPKVSGAGNNVKLSFVVDRDGTFAYFCSVPGHRQAGMEGKLIVGTGVSTVQTIAADKPASEMTEAMPAAELADASAVDITRDPTDLPAPIGNRGPENIRVDLETTEVSGILADGSTYTFWTFNGKVPGPFVRVRVGDTVEVHLKNSISSTMTHSVDFHAVTGPGGGAVGTQTQPGGETMFTFKALNPGLFVYHCATPMVAQHISNGMYGMILVEPEGGLAPVDREFYVMQGEIYTAQPFGTAGALTEDVTKLLNETPEYYVFNGSANALASEAHSLKAKTGETVRIYMGVGGPNKISSFHVIGEIFDRVFDQASLTSPALTDVQTTLVPPGGATMVEFKLEVPGRYILVDHALARLQRGLAGYLVVEGDPNPEVFAATPMPGSGH